MILRKGGVLNNLMALADSTFYTLTKLTWHSDVTGRLENDICKCLQGVAKAFSVAYHLVNIRQKMVCVCQRSLEWLVGHCGNVKAASLYLKEQDPRHSDFTLRKLISNTGQLEVKPECLERKDNIFRYNKLVS